MAVANRQKREKRHSERAYTAAPRYFLVTGKNQEAQSSHQCRNSYQSPDFSEDRRFALLLAQLANPSHPIFRGQRELIYQLFNSD